MSHSSEIRVFYYFACFVALFFAVFTNVFPPIGYPLTQLVFDYSHGLIRRGLMGTVVSWFTGDTLTLTQAHIASLLMTFSGAVALLVFLWVAFKDTIAGFWLLLLALCSYGFGSFIGHTGYLDGPIILCLVLALVGLSYGKTGYACAVFLVALATLIHENALPYISVALSCAIWLTYENKTFKEKLALAALPICAGAVVVFALLAFGQPNTEMSSALLEHVHNRAGFPLDPGALYLIERSLDGNASYLDAKRNVGGYLVWMTFDGGILAVMSLFVMLLNLHLVKARDIGAKVLVVGAMLAPWSLVFVAVDVMRFGAISVIVGFLLTAVIMRVEPTAKQRLAEYLTLPLFLVVLIFNLQSGNQQLNVSTNHFAKFPYALKTHQQWFTQNE